MNRRWMRWSIYTRARKVLAAENIAAGPTSVARQVMRSASRSGKVAIMLVAYVMASDLRLIELSRSIGQPGGTDPSYAFEPHQSHISHWS